MGLGKTVEGNFIQSEIGWLCRRMDQFEEGLTGGVYDRLSAGGMAIHLAKMPGCLIDYGSSDFIESQPAKRAVPVTKIFEEFTCI